MTKTIGDLGNIQVEHLLSLGTGLPLVKIRAESDRVVLLGQVDPDTARRIANHLVEAAARAEYERDFFTEACKVLGQREAAALLHMVRAGERRRHEDGE